MITHSTDQQVLIQVAKVLSNPTRLRMLQYLESAKYAMCTSFTRKLGVQQSQASRHLRKMLECGIVKKQLLGKTWIFQLNLNQWKAVQDLWKAASP